MSDILAYFHNGKLYELYGSTEAGWVTLLRADEQIARLGSVGREWAGSGAIKLLELFSRTAYVFNGHWKNSEKTDEAFRGDWCSVGDMARRDADGYIWLVARKSNMIISGGENIYPSEVEGVLGANPKVKDVRSSACRTRSGARRCRPCWCCTRYSRAAKKNFGPGARKEWPVSNARRRWFS